MLTAVLCAMLASPSVPAPPRVAVVSPTRGEVLPQLEPAVVEALEEQGVEVTRLRLGLGQDSVCATSMLVPECVERVRRRWTRKQPPLMVLGSITAEPNFTRAELAVLHRDQPEPIARFDARFVEGDLVLPIVLPLAVAEAIEHHLHPPAPPTDEEREQLSTLDEAPVRVAARAEPVSPTSMPGRGVPDRPSPLRREVPRVAMGSDGVDEALHLRRDFDALCRRGRRRPRASRDDPRDLRPRCSLGPVLGYVRPRTWVTASLALATGVASALAFRAQDDLGGERTRREAGAWGTAMAASSAVLGVAVVTLSIGDRWQARRYLRDERWLSGR